MRGLTLFTGRCSVVLRVLMLLSFCSCHAPIRNCNLVVPDAGERAEIRELVQRVVRGDNWENAVEALENQGVPAAQALADEYIENRELEDEAQRRVLWTLHRIGGKPAFSALLRIMRYPLTDELDLRWLAIHLCSVAQKEVPLTYMAEQLRERKDSPRVRAYLIEAAANTGDAAAAELVRPYLEDPEAEVRLSAARMLLAFGDSSGAGVIFDAIRYNCHWDHFMKAEALWALSNGFEIADFPEEEYVRRMKQLLQPRTPLQLLALLAITKMAGDSEVPEELGKAAASLVEGTMALELPWTRKVAVEVVGRSALQQKSEILWKLAKEDGDVDVQCEALFWLAHNGEEEARKPLRTFVRSGEPDVLGLAAGTLVRLGDRQELDFVAAQLRRYSGKGSFEDSLMLDEIQAYFATSFEHAEEWLHWYSIHKQELAWSAKDQRFKLLEKTEKEQ